MKYKVVDTFNPCFTSTAPRYSVYRKNRWFGWTLIGRSIYKEPFEIIRDDFESIPNRNPGEWAQVLNVEAE